MNQKELDIILRVPWVARIEFLETLVACAFALNCIVGALATKYFACKSISMKTNGLMMLINWKVKKIKRQLLHSEQNADIQLPQARQ